MFLKYIKYLMLKPIVNQEKIDSLINKTELLLQQFDNIEKDYLDLLKILEKREKEKE